MAAVLTNNAQNYILRAEPCPSLKSLLVSTEKERIKIAL